MPTHDTSSQSLLWAIQNHPQSKNPALLAQACAAAGFDALLLEASDDELPGVPWDRPVLFYGSCRFVSNVQRSGRWRPCAYFDPQLLRFSAYLEHYGARLLNHDAHSMRLCDAGDLPAGEKFFVRCDADSKELAGDVWSGAQLHSYVDKLLEANATALLDLPIVVAARRRIDYEWRLFVADGHVCGATQYRYAGELACARDVPQNVVDFAAETAAIWSPLPVFVIDVASCGADLFVLELNGFNSSGFYAADVGGIVRAVAQFAGRGVQA